MVKKIAEKKNSKSFELLKNIGSLTVSIGIAIGGYKYAEFRFNDLTRRVTAVEVKHDQDTKILENKINQMAVDLKEVQTDLKYVINKLNSKTDPVVADN